MAQVVKGRGRKAQCSNAALLDRFSNLPDPIIHHIFSFLDMDDIARTGVASKRCGQLFISSPFLKFKSICSYDGPPNMCNQFSDRVDGLLSHRNGLEIRRFCLHWACHHKDNCDIDLNLIDKWINVAVNCQAQEIDLEVGVGQEDPLSKSGEIPISDSEENIDQESDLEVGIGEEDPFSESDEIPISDSEENTSLDYQSFEDPIFELPRCMFSSKTLRILKLDLQYKRLKEPTGVFGFLEGLSLHFMVGSDSEKALRKLISTSCPLLKRLTLASIEDIKTLKINHPCLEELSLFDLPYNLCRIDISAKRLQKLSLDLNSLFPGHMCTMKINAPNLQDLKWTALTANNVYLSQFKFLKNASLSVGISNDYVEEATIRNRLSALLQGVCWSRVLHITSDVLETQFLHNRLPGGFDNLQQLVITVDGCLKDYHFPVLASILTRSPDLESLSITCSENRYQPDYSRKLKYKATKFCKRFNNLVGHQLQEIEIELKGKGHQVGVVENMLKIAKGLKKMTIICSKANLKSLSKIGLHDSRAASLSFKLNLVEKEFHIEEFRRIDYRRKLNLVKELYYDRDFFD